MKLKPDDKARRQITISQIALAFHDNDKKLSLTKQYVDNLKLEDMSTEQLVQMTEMNDDWRILMQSEIWVCEAIIKHIKGIYRLRAVERYWELHPDYIRLKEGDKLIMTAFVYQELLDRDGFCNNIVDDIMHIDKVSLIWANGDDINMRVLYGDSLTSNTIPVEWAVEMHRAYLKNVSGDTK